MNKSSVEAYLRLILINIKASRIEDGFNYYVVPGQDFAILYMGLARIAVMPEREVIRIVANTYGKADIENLKVLIDIATIVLAEWHEYAEDEDDE